MKTGAIIFWITNTCSIGSKKLGDNMINLRTIPFCYFLIFMLNIACSEQSNNTNNVALLSSESDDSVVAGALPTSGFEVPYQPNLWNDNPKILAKTNCYAYALNLVRDPVTQRPIPLQNGVFALQPGQLAGKMIDKNTAFKDPEGKEIIAAAKADAKAISGTFESVDATAAAPSDTYKVALAIDPGKGYHWYRQNPDGTWSHKIGPIEVMDIDASNAKILDPRKANRIYGESGYSWFVGFFAVKAIPSGAP
ncbi:MAG: hypothetical protein HQK54_09245 [Oligoflexales bacterium]|nr:hypothetical protein [Oligoflexales bacterium]